MKNNLFLLAFIMIAASLSSFAQSATVVFVNNHPLNQNDSLDLEIRNKTQDTVIYELSVKFQSSSPALPLPSTSVLTYNWRYSNNPTIFYTSDNQVVNTNANYFAYLYGSTITKEFERAAINPAASSNSKIRFILTQSIPGLQTVDFVVREIDQTIGNNLDYEGNTFNAQAEFDVSNTDSMTIDITDRHNQNVGLAAFKFDKNYFAGKSIFLYTSGTDLDMRLFAVELDGTTTELSKTAPVMNTSISDALKANVSLFPNPATTTLNIEFEQAEPVAELSIYDFSGRLFRQENIGSQMTTQLDISGLAKGLYLVKIETPEGYLTKSIQKQ